MNVSKTSIETCPKYLHDGFISGLDEKYLDASFILATKLIFTVILPENKVLREIWLEPKWCLADFVDLV